jgi:non-specific serine/threonine protein kinase/serine/threonine-protein kinase
MSPEQTEVTAVDIDTRTDVYSLGVLLYELLTGVRPFDFRSRALTFDEMRRRIREEEPTRPSTRARQLTQTAPDVARNRRMDPAALVSTLRGDLDWITMRALEKDRGRRYGSVSELAADVQRHLDHRPVLAGPSSTSYRVGKFVRRHKVGVGAAVAVVVALVLGLAAAGVGLVRAQRAEAQARREAETARQVSDFLVELFDVSDPTQAPTRAQGNAVTAREILDRGAERIRGELQDQPLVQAQLMVVLGAVHANLGLLEEAESLYRTGVDLREATLGENDLTVAKGYHNLALLAIDRGRYEEAERLARRSLEIRTALLDADDVRVAESTAGLANVHMRFGRLEEAQRLYERAVEVYVARMPDDPVTADIINDLGVTHAIKGDARKAEELFRRALEMAEPILGPDHPKIGLRLTSLGIVSRDLGRHEEAERHLRRALEIVEKAYGEDHPQVANTLYELGATCSLRGRHAEAEPLLERSLAIREARLGQSHPYVAETLLGLAELRRDQGRPQEAEAHYQRGLSILEDAVEPRHPMLVRTRESYAAFLRAQGREEEAADLEAAGPEAPPSTRGAAGR